jgi:hypothetical protein
MESDASQAKNDAKESGDGSLCGLDAHEVLQPLLRPSTIFKRMFDAEFAWSRQ